MLRYGVESVESKLGTSEVRDISGIGSGRAGKSSGEVITGVIDVVVSPAKPEAGRDEPEGEII